jgi:hypothetical protein
MEDDTYIRAVDMKNANEWSFVLFSGFFFFCQLFVLIILIFLKFYFIISYYFFDAWQLLLFHIIHHICSIIKYPCFQIDDQLL